MRHWLSRAFFVISAAVLLSMSAGAADFTWLAVDHVAPDPEATTAAALLASGRDQSAGVLSAAGDLVTLFDVSPQGSLNTLGSFVGDSAPATAMALEDLDSDGRWEFVTARGDEGALSVDRWVQGQRFPVGAPRYAWMPIKSLLIATTRSGKVVVAAGQSGGLSTYLVSGRGLEPAGVNEPRQRFELYGVGDLDGDGQDELVAGIGQSGVVVFRWTPGTGWSRWWQNFPWGGTVGAAIGDLDRDGCPELAVASAEGLLYVFGRTSHPTPTLELKWQGGRLVPVGTSGLVYFGAPGSAAERTEHGGLALFGSAGVCLLRFGPKWSLSRTMTPLEGVRQVLPVRPRSGEADLSPRLLVQQADGTLHLIAALRSDRTHLVWTLADGSSNPPAGTVVRGGRFYLVARDVAAQLGLTLRWNSERRAAEIVTPSGRNVQLLPDRPPLVNGEELAGAGPVIVEEGRTLLEARSIELLFPPARPETARLNMIIGSRRFPAASLW